MTSNAIEIKELFFQYAGSQRVIFSDFNWTVKAGDFWVIVGANGSGKTSLIRLLLGLESPARGSIQILGRNLKSLSGLSLRASERAARSQIGYVPQHLQFDRRLPIPVLDVVEGGVLPCSFWRGQSFDRRLTRKQRQESCLQALTQVGMESRAKERFSRLSEGQKQRVLIARALVTQSPILILDEPTASIDPTAAREIVQICQQLKKRHTILFVSHDISMIPAVCEHILCISPASSAELLHQSNCGSLVHSHNVQGMSRKDILLLLYSHWGLSDRSHG